MDTTCVEHMTTMQLFDLGSRSEHFKANGTAHFFLLTFYFFSFAFSEAILCTVIILSLHHLLFLLVVTFWCLLKFVRRDRIDDIFDFFSRWQRLSVRVQILIVVELILLGEAVI